ARGLLQLRLAAQPSTLVFTVNCLAHQYALMVKTALHHMDSFLRVSGAKYFYWSAVAKIMHSWRANAVRIFTLWCDCYSPTKAIAAFAHRVPPRPITGRWGSVRDCERHLLRCDRAQLRAIMTAAIGCPRPDDPLIDGEKQQQAIPTSGLNEIDQTDTAVYKEKMGKFASDALVALRDERFWLAMETSQHLRGPLDHMLHSVQQVRLRGQVSNLADMVFEKAAEIHRQIEDRIDVGGAGWRGILGKYPPDVASPAVIGCIKQGALKVHGDFQFRVVSSTCDSYPVKLLWLAYSPPHRDCAKRRDLARELLTPADPKALHITAATIVRLFKPELEALRSGTLSTCLYAPMRMVCEQWRCDTQEIEGINNMLQVVCQRAPRISLALLDARIGLRKEYGLGSRATATLKWSQIKDCVHATIDDSIQFTSEIRSVLTLPQRWAVPPLAYDPVAIPNERTIDAIVPKAAKEWAASYNMAWYWQSCNLTRGKDVTSSIIAFAGEDAAGDGASSAWLCESCFGYVGTFVKVNLVCADVDMVQATVSLAQPVVHMTSQQLFLRLYDRCKAGQRLDHTVGVVRHGVGITSSTTVLSLTDMVNMGAIADVLAPVVESEYKPKRKKPAEAVVPAEPGGKGKGRGRKGGRGGGKGMLKAGAAAAAMADPAEAAAAAEAIDGQLALADADAIAETDLLSGVPEAFMANADLAKTASAIGDQKFAAKFFKAYAKLYPGALEEAKEAK
ncbi:unnamed protein product, partial [Prorocentrum cordatum]